jgi:hypothetical protein
MLETSLVKFIPIKGILQMVIMVHQLTIPASRNFFGCCYFIYKTFNGSTCFYFKT